MNNDRSVEGVTVQLPGNEYLCPISLAAPAPNGTGGITSAVQPGRDPMGRVKIFGQLGVEYAVCPGWKIRAMFFENASGQNHDGLLTVQFGEIPCIEVSKAENLCWKRYREYQRCRNVHELVHRAPRKFGSNHNAEATKIGRPLRTALGN